MGQKGDKTNMTIENDDSTSLLQTEAYFGPWRERKPGEEVNPGDIYRRRVVAVGPRGKKFREIVEMVPVRIYGNEPKTLNGNNNRTVLSEKQIYPLPSKR